MKFTISFSFKGIHASKFNIAAESIRPLAPDLRRNDYMILSRHGTIEHAGTPGTSTLGTYANRQIAVDIVFVNTGFSREIAEWLNGKGRLIFDDEPDKYYDATIYTAIHAQELVRAKKAQIIFECFPFAKSVKLNVANKPGIIATNGTWETPVIIRMQNTGAGAIRDIMITRRLIDN